MPEKETKKEKREKRKLKKIELSTKKSVRFKQRVQEESKVRFGADLEDSNKTRIIENPDSIYELNMQYVLISKDTEGSWSWDQERQWKAKEWDDIIFPFLEEMQKLKWLEIKGQFTGSGKKRLWKHHDMQVETITGEAQGRWTDIELGIFETIFRFRLGGERRLWGYLIKETFHLVWWDPNHKIYPVTKKNT